MDMSGRQGKVILEYVRNARALIGISIKEERKNMTLVLKDNPSVTEYKLKDVLNKIILGDCISVMKRMEPEIADMVFIDPPYFLQLPKKRLIRWEVKTIVEGVSEDWDKFSSFKTYDSFLKELLTRAKKIMKPKATIWVIGTYHNIFRLGKIMQDLGFWILNDVLWVKTNPMPNWLGVRFTNATETLIWAVKDKKVKGYTFNKNLAREFGNGKLGLNLWHIPLCTGRERIKNEEGKKLHSTQKPEKLLERVILTSTKEGDVVFDPVAGSGTTGYVAKRLGRDFIMIDVVEKYVEAMEKRFANIQKKFV